MSEATQPSARLRASLASAAFAVEDRVLSDGVEAAKDVFDAVKWPFERLAWEVERRLIWPLQDRTSDWDRNVQAAGAAAVVLVAIGAGVLGLLWAAGGDSNNPSHELAAAPTRLPFASEAPPAKTAASGPVLHGVAPVFKAETGLGSAQATDGTAKGAPDAAPTSGAAASVAGSGGPAGPAALQVARRFADAFVLYEIGQGSAKAGAAFHATATPELAHSLLRRPPRLPTNVKVPKAKVVNVVAGPSHRGVFPVSISLLRVGVTSELRLDLQKQGKAPAGKARSGENSWLVTDVTG